MSKDINSQSVTDGNQIIEQFISNENHALENIYRHNFKIVRSYILKNNGTEADAKDIFQDALIAAWLNMKEGKFTLKNEFSLNSYIYKISKYKWLDKLKSKEMKTTQRIGGVEYEDSDDSMLDFDDAQDKVNYLNSLYNRLDDKCKEVLKLFYYQKKNLKDISSILNYDPGSIRTIKYRCMQKLRKMHVNSQTQID